MLTGTFGPSPTAVGAVYWLLVALAPMGVRPNFDTTIYSAPRGPRRISRMLTWESGTAGLPAHDRTKFPNAHHSASSVLRTETHAQQSALLDSSNAGLCQPLEIAQTKMPPPSLSTLEHLSVVMIG